MKTIVKWNQAIEHTDSKNKTKYRSDEKRSKREKLENETKETFTNTNEGKHAATAITVKSDLPCFFVCRIDILNRDFSGNLSLNVLRFLTRKV